MAECCARDVLLLEGSFAIYPKTTVEYHVLLTNSKIRYVPCVSRQAPSSSAKKSAEHVIKFSDVIGVDCMRGKTAVCPAAYLNVYAYVHQKKFASSSSLRRRQCVTFVFSHFSKFEENHQDALQWQLVMTYLSRSIHVKPEDVATLRPLPERRLLVLVNPFSGPGKALQSFQRHIVPMFAEAGLRYQLVVTERAGHARELVKELVLTDWYGIVIVSGDGLIFEVVNGLMESDDWQVAIKTPICALPGGSANALASALAHIGCEPYLEKPLLHATFVLAKHTVQPMDLVAVDTCTGKRLYSFLSVAWGIIADVDIESEKFRSLGNARFAVGAAIRIAGLRKYRGRISFLPVDEYRPRMKRHSCTDSERQRVSRVETGQSRSVSLNDASLSSAAVESASLRTPDRTARLDLPPLSSPLPSDWVTIEDDFVLVIAVSLTHIAQDMIVAPRSRLNDGVIYLSMVRAPISRVHLVKLFAAMQEGTACDDPGAEIVRVSAFRLEPLGGQQHGALVVDGEAVDYGPIQAQVMPSMARVMALVKE